MQWPEALAIAAVHRWERSRNFHLAPADRPLRIAFDAKTFPDAWAIGGYEEREAILRAALELERQGLAKIQRTGRGALATERALVLEGAAVEQAYQVLEQRGTCTRRAHARAMREMVAAARPGATGWSADYLRRVLDDLGRGRFVLLGRGAHEPGEGPHIRDALQVVCRLASREPFDERSLSGELFGDTKRIQALRSRVRQMLLAGDPQWADRPAPTDRELYGHYREVFKPPFTAVAAGAVIAGVADFRLFQPYAMLPAPLLMHLAEWAAGRTTRAILTTIENPTAFLRYLEEEDVRRGVRAGDEVVISTEGFASDDVVAFLECTRGAWREVRHWGDTDVHGLRIAELISTAAGGAALFRGTGDWVRALPRRLGRPLDGGHRAALEELVAAGEDTCTGVREAAAAVLAADHWYEQEVYYAASGTSTSGESGA